MPKQRDIIEFEDLRGNPDPDDREVDVDLDVGTDPAIARRARLDPETRDRKPKADDDLFDDLPSRVPRDDRVDDDPDRRPRGNEFEARLGRERTARQREKDRADAAERRAADLERELAGARKLKGETSRKELDDQITDIEGQLEAALEAEDTKRQVKLTSQLTDVKARRIALDYVSPERDDDEDRKPPPARNEHLDKFLGSHADWYKRDGFERQTRVLNRLDREVHADGYDPRSEDYFEELNRRMKKAHPEVFEDKDDDDDPDRDRDADRPRRGQDPRRTPVAGTDRDVDGRFARTRQNETKVRLTEADFANMRSFGLDVDDPEVLKEYARNKRQTEREMATR